MQERRVVIATGLDGLLAAAVLAQQGHGVLLLQLGPSSSGLVHPEIPPEPRRLMLGPENLRVAEAILGPLEPSALPLRAVAAQGKLHPLPLSFAALLDLLPPGGRAAVARSWIKARAGNGLTEILGSGLEERSHRDWVVRRVGVPAWEHLYRDYARRRWGLPSEDLASSLARIHHSGVGDSLLLEPVDAPGASLERAEAMIRTQGGEIRIGIRPTGIALEGGRASAILLEDGERIRVEGPLWAAVSPSMLARWLGDQIPRALRVDAERLPVQDAVRVALCGEPAALPGGESPDEVHIIGEGEGFWRAVREPSLPGCMVFSYTCSSLNSVPDDERELVHQTVRRAEALGIGQFCEKDARVERLSAWQPVWRCNMHPALRAVLLGWQSLGITPVGRGGAFADLDPGRVIAFARACANDELPDLLELQRTIVAPPMPGDDAGGRLSWLLSR